MSQHAQFFYYQLNEAVHKNRGHHLLRWLSWTPRNGCLVRSCIGALILRWNLRYIWTVVGNQTLTGLIRSRSRSLAGSCRTPTESYRSWTLPQFGTLLVIFLSEYRDLIKQGTSLKINVYKRLHLKSPSALCHCYCLVHFRTSVCWKTVYGWGVDKEGRSVCIVEQKIDIVDIDIIS